MDITERIHNAIEWANKRLTLQGQELSQEQKNYLTFALSQNFTDNTQALQLLQPDVMQSVLFADWIVKKGYKLNQMNYSNNGGMWFFDKKSVGCTTAELYKQYVSETVA
jgi:hypothetical protein